MHATTIMLHEAHTGRHADSLRWAGEARRSETPAAADRTERLLETSLATFVHDGLRLALRAPSLLAMMLRFARGQRNAARVRASWEARGTHVPPLMIASITETCNLRCRGCYAHGPRAARDIATVRFSAVRPRAAGCALARAVPRGVPARDIVRPCRRRRAVRSPGSDPGRGRDARNPVRGLHERAAHRAADRAVTAAEPQRCSHRKPRRSAAADRQPPRPGGVPAGDAGHGPAALGRGSLRRFPHGDEREPGRRHVVRLHTVAHRGRREDRLLRGVHAGPARHRGPRALARPSASSCVVAWTRSTGNAVPCSWPFPATRNAMAAAWPRGAGSSMSIRGDGSSRAPSRRSRTRRCADCRSPRPWDRRCWPPFVNSTGDSRRRAAGARSGPSATGCARCCRRRTRPSRRRNPWRSPRRSARDSGADLGGLVASRRCRARGGSAPPRAGGLQ